MSKYTTGEIAKLCGVSVRTVQYYDARGILVPTELSEGGRRLYSEDDLGKMKIICFLRDIGIPIDSIKELFLQDNHENVISVLLDEQEKEIQEEILEKQAIADKIFNIKKTLKLIAKPTVDSISDIACIMKSKKRLRKVRRRMIAVGIIMDIIEIATIVLWVKLGIWWPFALGMGFVCSLGILISAYYFKSVSYICPECHAVFTPSFKEYFFARHTPYTRRLTCNSCKHKGFCVEIATEERRNAQNRTSYKTL